MQSSVYNPFFTPMRYSPALWLDASDQSTLVMDGARTFTAASTQSFSVANAAANTFGNVDYWIGYWVYLPSLSALANSAALAKDGATGGAKREWNLFNYNASIYRPAFNLFQSDDTSVASAQWGSTLSFATWYFVFAWHDSVNDTVNITVNAGTPVTTSYSGKTPNTSTEPLRLGYNSVAASTYMDGRLDSVAFGKPTAGWLASNATALASYLYNSGSGRRSSDFISSALYSGSGAVSWWDMDARSGNETDRIGSNNLTDNGGVGYAAGIVSGLVQYTGDPVKQWSDKSGKARHVTAPSDAARFTYTTSSQNGLAGLTSDGINDVLGCTNFARYTTAVTIYMVGKRTSGLPGITVGYDSSTFGGGFVYYFNTTTSGIDARPLISGTYSSYKTSTATSITASSANVLCGTYSAATGLQFFHNGTAATPDVFASTNFGGSNFFLVGCVSAPTANGSDFGAGVFYEVAVFLEEHDATKRNNMIRYLGNKWGITVS